MDGLFIMPVCYHPTTILSVDDDLAFLKNLSLEVSDKIAILYFDDPRKAIEYTKKKSSLFPLY